MANIAEPPVIAPFTFASSVVNQGEFAQLMCSVNRGDEPLAIAWNLTGDVVSSYASITTTMLGRRTSILTISSVGHRHSGVYTCMASNPAGAATHSAELNVNGIYIYICQSTGRVTMWGGTGNIL